MKNTAAADASDKLMLQDLDGPAYRQWLLEPVVKQVVDARDRTMPREGPVAVSDGTFWWISTRTNRDASLR